ncbi:hypothetical protein ABFV05_017305 [Capra hircus]
MPRLEGDPEAQWSPDAPVPPSPVSLGSSSGPWAQAGTMVGQGPANASWPRRPLHPRVPPPAKVWKAEEGASDSIREEPRRPQRGGGTDCDLGLQEQEGIDRAVGAVEGHRAGSGSVVASRMRLAVEEAGAATLCGLQSLISRIRALHAAQISSVFVGSRTQPSSPESCSEGPRLGLFTANQETGCQRRRCRAECLDHDLSPPPPEGMAPTSLRDFF